MQSSLGKSDRRHDRQMHGGPATADRRPYLLKSPLDTAPLPRLSTCLAIVISKFSGDSLRNVLGHGAVDWLCSKQKPKAETESSFVQLPSRVHGCLSITHHMPGNKYCPVRQRRSSVLPKIASCNLLSYQDLRVESPSLAFCFLSRTRSNCRQQVAFLPLPGERGMGAGGQKGNVRPTP